MDWIKRFFCILQENDRTVKFLILPLGLLIALLAGVGLFVMFCDSGTQVAGKWFGTLDTSEGKYSKQDTLMFIGWLMGGVLAAIGVLMIGRRADAQVENNKIASENNKLIEKGHIEERFRVAAEHLGKELTRTRIAAFYQLYHLAKESKNEDFRQNILDILCSYLRETTRDPKYQKDNKTKPSEEIQLLLDILFKPKNKYDTKAEGKTTFRKLVPDLHGVYLVGADLNNAYLLQADFSDACLIKADMGNTKLHKCIFNNTKMQGTYLSHANMQLAIFDGTKLMGSDLFNANMQGAVLRNEVGLQAAHLYLLKMQGVEISGATGNTITETYNPDSPHGVHAEGAYSTPSCATICTHNITDYEVRILRRAGKKGDISGIYLPGNPGTSKEDIDDTVKFLENYIGEAAAIDYQKKLQGHTQKLPKETTEKYYSGRIYLTAYKEEHTEKWIAEYNEVMKPTPETENK